MRPGLFRDPAAAFFVRGVAVFRRRSRFGDPGKEENFRCGPVPRALPCAASCAVCAALCRIWRRMRAAWPALCGGAYANGIVCAVPRMRTVGACFALRRVRGRRVPYAALRAAHESGLRVKFSLFCKRGPFRAPVSLTASCVGACPAGDRSFPRAFARGAARMRADTKRVSVLLYRKGRGKSRAPFRRLRRCYRLARRSRRLSSFFFAACGGVIFFFRRLRRCHLFFRRLRRFSSFRLAAVFSALRRFFPPCGQVNI